MKHSHRMLIADPNSYFSQATGMYTNSWDPNNGQILISTDKGNTWTASKLSFKVRDSSIRNKSHLTNSSRLVAICQAVAWAR